MQTVSSNFLAAVQGSNTPVYYADLWKNGTFVTRLPIESANVAADANSDVQFTGQVVVADADGTLTPTSMGDSLTPFGATVNILAGFNHSGGIETVSMGWFLIWDMDIEEAWSSMTDSLSGTTTLVRKGSRITLNLRDLTQKIKDYKFLAPSQPTQSSAWAEIVYLVGDVIQTQDPGFTPVSIPANLTYGEDRFEAVKALAALHLAEPFITPDGRLTLRLLNPAQDSTNTAPTFGWTINLVQYKKTLTRDGVYNVVVGRGKDATTSNSLVAYSIKSDGPTSFYGDFGPRAVFYANDLLSSQAAVQAFADSQLNAIASQNTQTVPVKALPNPAIQLGDYASLSVQGSSTPVLCRVIGYNYPSEGEMDVTLSMPSSWVA